MHFTVDTRVVCGCVAHAYACLIRCNGDPEQLGELPSLGRLEDAAAVGEEHDRERPIPSGVAEPGCCLPCAVRFNGVHAPVNIRGIHEPHTCRV